MTKLIQFLAALALTGCATTAPTNQVQHDLARISQQSNQIASDGNAALQANNRSLSAGKELLELINQTPK